MEDKKETWEEKMYWNHFHIMHFLVYLPKDFRDHLVLPAKFAEHMSSNLPRNVTLVGPSGPTWDTEVSKTGNIALVGDGWKDFTKAYELEENCLLLFKYKQNSSFDVLIFDQISLCEKEATYFVHKCSEKKPAQKNVGKRSVSKVSSTEVLEDDENGGFEFVVTKKAKTAPIEEAVCVGHRNSAEDPRKSSSDASFEDDRNDPDFLISKKSRKDAATVVSGEPKSSQSPKSCGLKSAAARAGEQGRAVTTRKSHISKSRSVKKSTGKRTARVLAKKSDMRDDHGGSEFVSSKKDVAEKGVCSGHRSNTEAPSRTLSDSFSEDNGNDLDSAVSNKSEEVLLANVYSRKQKNLQGPQSSMLKEAMALTNKHMEAITPRKSSTTSNAESLEKASRNNTAIELRQNSDVEATPLTNGQIAVTVAIMGTPDNCNAFLDDVSMGTASPDNEASPPKTKSSQQSKRGRGSRGKRGPPKSAKKFSDNKTKKRLPMEFISNRRPVTDTEKLEALERAGQALAVKSFIVVMRPTCVYKRFYMNIPADWMHKHLPRRNHKLLLSVGGKTWDVIFNWHEQRSTGGIGTGWKYFALENNLEEHDVCLFKLANEKDDTIMVLDVEIFRVVEEIVPVSPL